MQPLRAFLIGVASFGFFALSASAITINGFTAAAGNRWAGTPTDPILGPFTPNTNAAFVGLGYDFTGVGWQSSSTGGFKDLGVTLISPMHFAQGKHVAFGWTNATYTFFNADGVLVSRSIGNTLNKADVSATDFPEARVIRLDSAFTPADKVSVYRMLDVGPIANLVGYPAMLMGHDGSSSNYQRRVGLSTVSAVDEVSEVVYFDTATAVTNYATRYVVGDSGNPSFITYQGQLHFVGCHWFANLIDQNWLVPTVYPGVNAFMATDGYALRWTIDTTKARTWTGATDGAFSAPTNWNGGLLPSSSYSAVLDGNTAANRALTVGAASTVRGLFVKSAAGANPFTLGGGTLTLMESGLRNEDADAFTINAPITLGGSQNWEAAAGPLVISGNVSTAGFLVVLSGDQPITFTGNLSGNGSVSWDNPGTWTPPAGQLGLSGKLFVRRGTVNLATTNAYAGGTVVTGGTLLATNASGSATGSGPVTVSSGGRLGGNGTISGNVTLQPAGGLSASLTTAPGSHDRLDITGALALGVSSTLTITANASATVGTYPLVTAAGGITGSLPTLNLPSGWSATAQISGNSLNLVVTSLVPTAPVINAGQTTTAYLNTAFSYPIAAIQNPTSFALVGGSLPPGVTLNATTGVLSGTPTATGAYVPVFTATNAIGTSTSVGVSLLVAPAVSAIISESFVYPLGSNNPDPDAGLNSGNGLPAVNVGGNPTGTSTGLRNNWGTTLDVVTGLTYAQSGRTLVTAGGAACLSATGPATPAYIYRFMSTDPSLSQRVGGVNNGNLGVNGTSLYFSVLGSTSSATADSFRLSFKYDNSANFYLSNTATGWAFHGTPLAGASLALNTPTFFVLRFDFAAGGTSVSVWVNPPLGAALGTPNATISGLTFPGFLDYQANPTVANAMIFDELRVGTTAASVMPFVDPPGPNAPTALSATANSGSQITLSWTDTSSDETGFKLERSADGSTGWTQIATPSANASSYADTGLTSGTTYYYRIRATNANGDSAYASVANATTLAPPAAPSGVLATANSSTQITVSWTDNSANETGFNVERSPDGSTGWSQIAAPGANATSVADAGLNPSTTYYYRVRATNAVGDSAFSAVANGTTSALGVVNHGTLQFSQGTYTVTESSTDGAFLQPTLSVARTISGTGPVTASYCVWASEVTNNAIEDVNYYFNANTRKWIAAGTISWADGDTAPKTITIPPNTLRSTSTVQGTVTYDVRLVNVIGGAALGVNATSRLEVLDAQAPAAGVFNFSARRFYGADGGSGAVISVRRDGGGTGAVSVNYATSSTLPTVANNGVTIPAGVAGTNYTATAGTLTWADGDTSVKTFTVPLPVSGNTGGTMNVALNLSSPTNGAVLGTVPSALLTIQNKTSTLYDINDPVDYLTYRVSLPSGSGPVRGVLFLLPGTGGDFRGLVTDPQLRAAADVWRFALVGINGNSAPSPNSADFPEPSLAWLFDRLAQIANTTGRAEIANAPFAFTGFSAGAYGSSKSLMTWPERTIGVMAQRGWEPLTGGVTLNALQSEVPGLLLPGSTDTTAPPSQVNLALNGYRRNNFPRAALAMSWSVGHSFSPSAPHTAFALYWLDQVMAAGRYPANAAPTANAAPVLGSLPVSAGWWGARNATNDSTNGYQIAGGSSRYLTIGDNASYAGIKDPNNALVDSWLPNENTARAYRAYASLPSISFSAPANFAAATVGAPIALAISENGYGAGLTKVEFYDGSTKIGEDTTSPYGLSWTPDTAGLRSLTAVASTAGGPQFTAATLTVVAAPVAPTITAGQVTGGAVNVPFNYQIAAGGPPTSYALASGSLPPGVTLNPSTGFLTGTPTTVGTYTPSFTATNALGTSAAVMVTINVTPSTSSDFGAGQADFNSRFLVTLSAGTPAWASAGYTATGGISDSGYLATSSNSQSALFNTAFSWAAGESYTTSVFFKARVTAGSVAAGAGMRLGFADDNLGTFQGMEYVAAGINGSNGAGGSGDQSQLVLVSRQSGTVTATGPNLGTLTDNNWYQLIATFMKTGTAGQFSVVVSLKNWGADGTTGGSVLGTSSALVATGLTNVYNSTGVYAGFSGASNGAGNGVRGFDNFAVTVPLPAPVITANQSSSGTVGVALSYAIQASNSPTSYALAGGSLPAGVTLNATTGVLNGTPTASGTFTPSFTATNAGGTSSAVGVTLSIAAPAGIMSFRSAQGLAADGSQDLLTPGGDGVANLLKYAFNMIGSGAGQGSSLSAPNAAVLVPGGSAGLPYVGVDGTGKVQITYIRRKAAGNPGISYAVEFSDALSSWSTNALASESATLIDTTFERVTVTDSLASPLKRFVRVKVSSP